MSEADAVDTIDSPTMLALENQENKIPRLKPCVNQFICLPLRQSLRLHFAYEPHLLAIMVGLPGFEPGSNAPKASSIDQTNPQARE